VRLTTFPVTRRVAHAYVRALHRHLRPPVGDYTSFAVEDEQGTVHGVAIIGRPSARLLDAGRSSFGKVAEITRVATDGQPNACSALYGACCRWARGRGFDTVLTYTLADEPGHSLRGAGFEDDGVRPGGTWTDRTPFSPFMDMDPPKPEPSAEVMGPKRRWLKRLKAGQ
jgi:hypothetical protein